jgi:hypothetical protein
MGRKKKAKKLIREAIKEQKKKNIKSPKKSKNNKKEKSKKLEKQIVEKKVFPIKKLLALIAFMFFSTTTILLIIFSFKATDIANFLPEEETVFFMSLNSDLDNLQNQKAIKSLSNNPIFSKKNIENKIGELFASSYDEKIKPWLGRNAGLILLRNDKQELSPIFFLEVKSKKKTLETLNIQDENRQIMPLPEYFFPKNDFLIKPSSLIILDSYFFFASEQALTDLLLAQRPETAKLIHSQSYQNIKINSPRKKIAFFFLNNQKLNSSDLRNLEDLFNIDLPKEFILDLFQIYLSEGISIFEENGTFLLSAFTNLKTPISQNENFTNNKLVSLIPDGTKTYFLTENLLKELIDFSKISQIDISPSLANTISKSLLTVITFEDDIKPILNHRAMVFALNKDKKGIILSQINEESKSKLKEILYLFAQANSGFDKEMATITLPDNTRYNEYIKVPKKILLESIENSETEYFFYTQNKKPINIYYSFIEDYAVIVSDPELIIEIQEKIKNEEKDYIDIKTNNIFYLNLEETLKTPYNPFKNLSIESVFQGGGIFSKTILKTK